MATIHELISLQEQNNALYQPLIKWWPGQIIAVNGSIFVPDQPNYVWVQMPTGAAIPVLNMRITPAAFEQVIIGYDPVLPSILQILSFAFANGATIVRGSGILPHQHTHVLNDPVGGTDVPYFGARQLLPLRVSIVSGFTVKIEPSPEAVTGGFALSTPLTLDLSADVPASGSRYDLLYITPLGVFSKRAGTVILPAGFPPASATYADIPAPLPGERALAAAKLFSGQAQLNESPTSDIVDLRFTQGSGMGTPVATQIGQVLISLDGATFVSRLPVTDPNAGWLVDGATGLMMVV